MAAAQVIAPGSLSLSYETPAVIKAAKTSGFHGVEEALPAVGSVATSGRYHPHTTFQLIFTRP